MAIDLSSEGWPAHQLPYLSSLHSSAITTSSYVTDCGEAAYQRLVKAGEQQRQPASQKVRGRGRGWRSEEGPGSDRSGGGTELGALRLHDKCRTEVVSTSAWC